ncbi:MAG: DUF3472 domain-containing protein [Acidobacteriota bacterium]
MLRRALLSLAFAALAIHPTVAQQQQNANLYAYYNWSANGPFMQNLDQELVIRQKAHSTYWSMIFSMPSSDGGYLGLQTDGNRFDKSTGDTAIFSLWGAIKSNGPACGDFGGEGTGLSCRLAFPITPNHWYRLRVWKVSANSRGVWWGAWIMDETTNQETYLGQIEVGPKQNSMSDQANFSEFYGAPVASPNLVPRSIAVWSTPAADEISPGSYQFNSTFKSGTKADGTTGSVVAFPLVSPLKHTQAVRITQGG